MPKYEAGRTDLEQKSVNSLRRRTWYVERARSEIANKKRMKKRSFFYLETTKRGQKMKSQIKKGIVSFAQYDSFLFAVMPKGVSP